VSFARLSPALLLALAAAALLLLQLGIGGARLVYALPAFMLAGLAGLVTVALRGVEQVAPRRSCLVAALALGGYVIARGLASPVEMLARQDVFTAAAALVLYLVSVVHLGGAQARFTLLLALMFFAVVQVGVSVWQFKDQANFMLLPWIFRPDYGFKASGLFVSPNHLATLLGMLGVVCLSIACWGRVEITARAFAFYGFIVCLTGTALTGSRGGYYSVAAGLLVFLVGSILLARGFRRPHFFSLVIATALVLTVIVAVVLRMVVNSDIYEKRLRHVRDPGGKALMLVHTVVAQHQLSPAFGTGAGTYLYYSRQFRHPSIQSEPQHAHNDPLEFLAEYGWTGVALAGIFLLTHLAGAIAGIRRVLAEKLNPTVSVASNELALLLGAGSALVLALVHSLADFTFHLPAIALLAAFLFSILANPTSELASRHPRRVLPWWFTGIAPVAGLILLAAAAWRWPGEILAEQARLALRDHDPARAADLARRAVARDPAQADAHYTAGEALHYLALQTADPARVRELREQAVAAFTAGLAHFPQDVRLLLKLGRTLDDLGQLDAAGPIFERALAAAPASAIAHACFGLHLHRCGALGRAGDFYRSAQALGETQLSAAGLIDLERDLEAARTRDAFSDLVPEPPTNLPAAER